MTTTSKERTELRDYVTSRGYGVDIIDQRAPKALWQRPDGRVVELPADHYHMGLYRNKGFNLVPPGTTVGLQEDKPEVAATGPAANLSAFASYLPDEGESNTSLLTSIRHPRNIHTYEHYGVGAPCTLEDCPATRKVPYKAHKKITRLREGALQGTE